MTFLGFFMAATLGLAMLHFWLLERPKGKYLEGIGVVLFIEFEKTFRLWESWRAARPNLHVGQSPYAQDLLKKMIRIWRELHRRDPALFDAGILEKLEWWLNNDNPPPLGPTPSQSGFSFSKLPTVSLHGRVKIM